MNKDPTILILDDDEKWIALHERRLTRAGFDCITTQLAREAIKIGKTYSSIKFALIDEILVMPPIPADESQWIFQDWQGSDVVREINAQRSDVQFIMVTSAPQQWSQGDPQLLIRQEAKLRRQRGVIDLIHKQEIEEDPDGGYGWLIGLLKQPQSAIPAEGILVGLGVPSEVLNGLKYQRLGHCLKETGASDYELNDAIERFLFQSQPLEKTIFIETPGSKKLDCCNGIRANSQSFQILEFLAQQAEQGKEPLIREADYQYSPRCSSKKADAPPELDPRSVKDFAYEVGETGRKQQRFGVQIEGRSPQKSPLKVAIHRLRQQLIKLNVGTESRLFTFQQGGYRPSFKTGIVLYSPDALKRRRR